MFIFKELSLTLTGMEKMLPTVANPMAQAKSYSAHPVI